MDGAFPGLFAVYHKTDWIAEENYIVWFKKFVEFSNTIYESQCYSCLMDTKKSLEPINLARERNVIITILSPHTTHRLQLLYIKFYGFV